jgi:hypothetical protein
VSWKPFFGTAEIPADAAEVSARYSGRRMGGQHLYAILTCDACGIPVGGDAGTGLLVFARGHEVHYEEPPLCARCSIAIGVTALVRWAEEEEEG